MNVNSLTVVAAFTCALELALGGISVAAAVRLRRRGTDAGADAVPALFLPGVVLAALAVASIPLLYLLLVSWVPQWPGAMCVQGIVRIGTGGAGLAGLPPTLLALLVATKPLLVFAAGGWMLLHLVDRGTRTAPVTRWVVALLAVAGAVAVLDGATQGAYLLLPKQDRVVSGGCCTTAGFVTGGDGVSPSPLTVAAAFFGLALAGTAAAAGGLRSLAAGRTTAAWSIAAAACAVGTLWSGGEFLSGVLSPSRLRLPFHGCAHCLLAAAPEFSVGIALALVGAWCAGWAALVSVAAAGTEADVPSRRLARRLLVASAFAFPAAALMGLSGWWLA